MKYLTYLILMILSEVLILAISLSIYFNQKNKKDNQLKGIILLIMASLFVWTFSLIMQILFQNSNISPTFFEGLTSFGACFLPVFLLFLGIIFGRTRIKFRWYYGILFIIPVLSTILMFTNDWHHLMYQVYSVDLGSTVYGNYFIIHSFYSYSCIFVGLALLLFFSIRNSGLFSKQSLLLILGTLIPLIINILGTFGVADLTVYITPISFTFGISCYALAIFKFDFLKVAPIALQKIVDRISDSYIVLNESELITDFNKTFLTTFKLQDTKIRGENVFNFLKDCNVYDDDFANLEKKFTNIQKLNKTISFQKYFPNIDKYFNIEINVISSNSTFLGILVLFRDVTQHIQDMQQIQSNQETLMERERLASLGQLIGGIAHNLKTPIMSISGAAEGLTDLIKEYDSSIDDPEVNSSDHHDIAKDMSVWVEKIRNYTEYMSDVITAVKGQAVALSNDEDIYFTIDELIKRVNILMKHELKNAIIYLNTELNSNENISLKGDINSLVQVLNNMISNSIQAYDGKPEQKIDLTVNKVNNNVVLSVRDYASGLPTKVKDKLFKEMITTKGKNGTGLGLYMSYSTIKAHFNGNITVDSELQKGCTFNIIIPISQ